MRAKLGAHQKKCNLLTKLHTYLTTCTPSSASINYLCIRISSLKHLLAHPKNVGTCAPKKCTSAQLPALRESKQFARINCRRPRNGGLLIGHALEAYRYPIYIYIYTYIWPTHGHFRGTIFPTDSLFSRAAVARWLCRQRSFEHRQDEKLHISIITKRHSCLF